MRPRRWSESAARRAARFDGRCRERGRKVIFPESTSEESSADEETPLLVNATPLQRRYLLTGLR
jgi:hypothetical protein